VPIRRPQVALYVTCPCFLLLAVKFSSVSRVRLSSLFFFVNCYVVDAIFGNPSACQVFIPALRFSISFPSSGVFPSTLPALSLEPGPGGQLANSHFITPSAPTVLPLNPVPFPPPHIFSGFTGWGRSFFLPPGACLFFPSRPAHLVFLSFLFFFFGLVFCAPFPGVKREHFKNVHTTLPP